MIISQLRRKHPRLIYQDFEAKPDGKSLLIVFNFLLTPDIRFRPEISIPLPPSHQGISTEMIFNLGMIETISYWKAACPPELIVEAGHLSSDQIAWWKHLFIHGLGEFFYRNRIDFTAPDFLTIRTQTTNFAPNEQISANENAGAKLVQDNIDDLISVGGGKDSIVTLETLKQLPSRKTALMLNPGPNSLAAARIAGYKNPIIVTRTIDPKLLQLNKLRYLNGHTPFSAYLAFLGILVAYLHGYKNVISSNELGAGEASLIYKNMEINHQYSKSFAFEKKFREYCRSYLNQDINYFSFLRPLYELQIAKIFSLKTGDDRRRFLKYSHIFISCNVGRGKFWCGRCPKCAFNYLCLFPFMSAERLKSIFKSDLFEISEIQKHILDLVGLRQHKPFDCVGTQDESILAVALAIRKLEEQRAKSEFLTSLKQKLNLGNREFVRKLEKKIFNNWSDQNFLPPEYSRLLKKLIGL